MTWPTLEPANLGLTKGAGALFHQAEVRTAIRQWGEIVMAVLSVVPDGQYAGAVRIHVQDLTVGSIHHGLSDTFREIIDKLRHDGRLATLRIRLEIDEPYVDVWLPYKVKLVDEQSAFLSGLGSARVELDDTQAQRLDASLHSKAKTKSVTRVGSLARSGENWNVVLDGEVIGLMRGSNRYVEDAERAGFPLTCPVGIKRQPGKELEVLVGLPG